MARISDPEDDEFVNIQVDIWAVTPKAVLVSKEGRGEDSASWIPRSQCQFSGTPKRDTSDLIGVKRWVAKREGMLE